MARLLLLCEPAFEKAKGARRSERAKSTKKSPALGCGLIGGELLLGIDGRKAISVGAAFEGKRLSLKLSIEAI
jgi:hypothetical protein